MALTGLILTGGGARAAYQVGVLKGIHQILDQANLPHASPFQIICGTSAGAINAAALASRADHFSEALNYLLGVWQHFRVEQVYRSDSLSVIRTGSQWLTALSFGWMLRKQPRSLLDNSPLRDLLNEYLDLDRLQRVLRKGSLRALAVSASSYTSGQHHTFYQTSQEITPWHRTQRLAQAGHITVDHLMASAAIPFIFPAHELKLGDRTEYFGDGSMRQLAPISPAIHLGAEKILVIGGGQSQLASQSNAPGLHMHGSNQYPSLAQISGHALSSIFLDSLSGDIERLQRINRTLKVLTPEQRAHTDLRPIALLVISPSQRLDKLAVEHIGSLPRPIRTLLGGVGGTEARGAALASYLLFESGYTQALIRLGYGDTLAKRQEVLTFFANEDALIS